MRTPSGPEPRHLPAPARVLGALLVSAVFLLSGAVLQPASADPAGAGTGSDRAAGSGRSASAPASARTDDGPLLPTVPDSPSQGADGSSGQQDPPPAVDEPDQGTGTPSSPWALAGLAVLVTVSVLLSLVALTTLWWMLHAWRSTQSLEATRFSRTPVDPTHSFSLLVPARHEETVLGHTIDRLAASDHPDFEIIVIIGHDDPGTEAVARAAESRHPGLVRVVIDHSTPKNKPRGMNTALPEVRKDVVGVFDAEDEVHPALLRLVDARFSETGADLVQGGVQLMNVQSSWWSLRNCLEYYFWFRSRLHFHAEARFIPLGGNTVFVRTDLLREAGGWDGDCLAEDCELGVRLSTRGARVAVAYDPEVVTREETPGSFTSLFKQRTRWSQGFLQVLRKGAWRQLPTFRQRALARYTLAMPFLQAFTGLMIPVSIVLVFTVKVPVVVALATFLPVVPTLVTVAVEVAGLDEFGRTYGVKIRLRDYVKLVIGTFPYQVMLAAAAIRAAWRELRGDSSWEKTEHSGAHVVSTPTTATTVPTPVIPGQRQHGPADLLPVQQEAAR